MALVIFTWSCLLCFFYTENEKETPHTTVAIRGVSMSYKWIQGLQATATRVGAMSLPREKFDGFLPMN